MSSGIPIQNWSALVAAVVQGLKSLQNPPPIRYRYTYENMNVQLKSNVPARVLALPDGNEYEILLRNLTSTDVSLYIADGTSDGSDGASDRSGSASDSGDSGGSDGTSDSDGYGDDSGDSLDGGVDLSTNNSGLYLKSLGGKVLYRSGSFLLYAIAPTEAEIAITVHSDNKNLSRRGKQEMIPLNIDLLFGTTASNRKFFDYIIPTGLWDNDYWRNAIEKAFDSAQGIPGHNVARLASFQPGNTYSFTLTVSGSIDWASGGKIRVYLLDADLLLFTAMELIGRAADRSVTQSEQKLVGKIKQWRFVKAELPPEGGQFAITPLSADKFIFFDIQTSNGWDGGVITSFNRATNTFTLGGY